MMLTERLQEEQLDLDSVPEYVRESKTRAERTAKAKLLDSASAIVPAVRSVILPSNSESAAEEVDEAPEQDVLETLWPGIHQDFFHTVNVKRTPSFYITLGFMGGAVLVLILCWGFSFVSSLFSHYAKLSGDLNSNKSNGNQASTVSTTEAIMPAVTNYEVQNGDTLAGIALKNYQHISPRLIDEICKANNLTNADVLSLGQKLVLPEYHPQK